jgi:hypothetical protein
MLTVTILKKNEAGSLVEVATARFEGVMVQRPDGTTKVPMSSPGERESPRMLIVRGTMVEDILRRIREQLEIGRATGTVDEYTWRVE